MSQSTHGTIDAVHHLVLSLVSFYTNITAFMQVFNLFFFFFFNASKLLVVDYFPSSEDEFIFFINVSWMKLIVGNFDFPSDVQPCVGFLIWFLIS